MSNERIFFEEQIKSLKKLSSLFQYLQETAKHMAIDSLLRAEYVLIVSSFDSYMHNIVRRKIRESFLNGSSLSSSIQLSMEDIRTMMSADSEIELAEILDAVLRKLLSKDSYQSPQSIEYAWGLMGFKSIWKCASQVMNDTSENIKKQLSVLIQRRNQIVHEADIDFMTGTPRDIDEQTASDCRDFLQKLVGCIDSYV